VKHTQKWTRRVFVAAAASLAMLARARATASQNRASSEIASPRDSRSTSRNAAAASVRSPERKSRHPRSKDARCGAEADARAAGGLAGVTARKVCDDALSEERARGTDGTPAEDSDAGQRRRRRGVGDAGLDARRCGRLRRGAPRLRACRERSRRSRPRERPERPRAARRGKDVGRSFAVGGVRLAPPRADHSRSCATRPGWGASGIESGDASSHSRPKVHAPGSYHTGPV